MTGKKYWASLPFSDSFLSTKNFLTLFDTYGYIFSLPKINNPGFSVWSWEERQLFVYTTIRPWSRDTKDYRRAICLLGEHW